MAALNEPKPFASLGPTLLARKGGARPAMRPQVTPLGALAPQSLSQSDDDALEALEDLGWNDMGDDFTPPAPTSIPEVLRQREALADSVVEPVEAPAPQPVVDEQPEPDIEAVAAPAPVRQQSVARTLRTARGGAGKAAFTLRLPADRHLRLRLACAVRNRSAQQLVTEALDRLLDDMPELSELVRQLPDLTVQKD